MISSNPVFWSNGWRKPQLCVLWRMTHLFIPEWLIRPGGSQPSWSHRVAQQSVIMGVWSSTGRLCAYFVLRNNFDLGWRCFHGFYIPTVPTRIPWFAFPCDIARFTRHCKPSGTNPPYFSCSPFSNHNRTVGSRTLRSSDGPYKYQC